jgi:hypothetical protein
VRDDPTRVTFTPAEMEGMPEAYLKAHEARRTRTATTSSRSSTRRTCPSCRTRRARRRRKRTTSPSCRGRAKNLDSSTRSSRCARSWPASTACLRSPTTRCAARWSARPES